MKYFITGITGTVVPIIVEELLKKDDEAFFYFAIRGDSKGNDAQSRFDQLVDTLDLTRSLKRKLRERSKLVNINIENDKLGIEPAVYQELITNTDQILHGAADVRFDQPYEKIRIPNVVFTKKIYDLYSEIKRYRKNSKKSDVVLYYISTSYAYGHYKGVTPEDYPNFHPGRPDNTYAKTKAEAKFFILEKIKKHNDKIVIFEPTIIGGSSRTGKTKTYNLHYIVIMLGYLGKLPLLTAANNTLDIVPVDWVAAVISDIMAKNEFHQGVLRLASGSDAVTIQHIHDVAYNYLVSNDPVPGHVIPKIHFVPRWCFYSIINFQKYFYRAMYVCTGKARYRKLVKGISLLEGYFPYITRFKVFENTRSMELIRRHTDCSNPPMLQDILDASGKVIKKGYFEKILADTINTGWGGMIDYERLERKTDEFKKTQALNAGLQK